VPIDNERMSQKSTMATAPRPSRPYLGPAGVAPDSLSAFSLVPKEPAWSTSPGNPDVDTRSANWAEKSRSGRR
jgi:hypothetical protein